MTTGPLGRATRRVIARYAPMPVRRWVGAQVIDDRATLHDFWRGATPEGNVPASYVEHTWRSHTLHGLLEDVSLTASVLEVGCNVGRNLAYLRRHGRERLAGIEISEHAVALLRRTYPELDDVPIHVGAAEDVLPRLRDREFDVVFTMAVLEHIHPDSVEVFDHIARVGSALLTIEPPPTHLSHRQYPHDVVALFRERGMRCVAQVPLSALPGVEPDLEDYVAARFVHDG